MERAMLEYLANALWQLPVLAAGAWALLWLMKPAPQTQYRVWLAVLGLAVVLPACGIRGGKIAAVPGANFDEWATARIVQRSAAMVAVDATAPATVIREPLEESDTAKGMWRLPSYVQRVHLSARVTHWVLGVYVGSVLLGLLRVVRAWLGARRLVENSREVVLCSTAEAVLNDVGRSLGVRLPEVRECAEVTSPMVVGAVAPVVLLPEGFAGHAEDEVKAALLHELAHVKRRDYLINGICQLTVLPVGWHPVACGVERRIRRTREMVCDEMAARAMHSEIGYARCLLTMARGMLVGGLAERPEFVALFSNNVLEERVMRLMETKTVLSARTRLVRLASGATAMAAATLMATSFHVVPTTAAESKVGLPVWHTAVLASADPPVPVVAHTACVHRLAKPAVAPPASVMARTVVAPAALDLATTPDAVPAMTPVASPVPQSVPAMAPPARAAAPTPPAVAPAAPPVAPATPQVAPVAPAAPTASTDEKKMKGSKNKHSLVYRMTGPDDERVVIVDGEVHALTPEEKQQIEKAMANSAEEMKKAMAAVDSEEFKRQMAAMQEEMTKIKVKAFDSDEFNKQMNAARQKMAKQSAWMNSAEFHEKMANVQAMVKNLDMQPCQNCKCKDDVGKDKGKQKTGEPKIK
ncbi:MAG TPA: M56 family metallopeptidase [Edaphobacter sp.]|nr:M56 family metallopeptidase [Edaphobacter sp.]